MTHFLGFTQDLHHGKLQYKGDWVPLLFNYDLGPTFALIAVPNTSSFLIILYLERDLLLFFSLLKDMSDSRKIFLQPGLYLSLHKEKSRWGLFALDIHKIFADFCLCLFFLLSSGNHIFQGLKPSLQKEQLDHFTNKVHLDGTVISS